MKGGAVKVLVTGANGHVGNNLCRALLERGHQVRASIRSLGDAERRAPLEGLENIELCELDVRDATGFDAAARDVEVLFHVAATYSYHTGSRQADDAMVRDSVEGAENALRSAARNGVRKVVLTSSIAALPWRPRGEPPATEQEWQTDLRLPYARAKTLAERRAWELSAELGVQLVSVLPASIGGPGFYRRTGTTNIIEGIMLGTMRFGAPRSAIGWVDIRDVVRGHVLAAERDVRGRFLLCNDHFPELIDLTRILHQIYPTIPAAPRVLPESLFGVLPALDALSAVLLDSPRVVTAELVGMVRGVIPPNDNSRAKAELGWKPEVALEVSLSDTVDAIRALRRAEGKGLRVFARTRASAAVLSTPPKQRPPPAA
jgi:dihydroflavonol-4-reductase